MHLHKLACALVYQSLMCSAQNTGIVFNINNDNMCACSISWTGFISQRLMTLYQDIDHTQHYGINATYMYMYDALHS